MRDEVQDVVRALPPLDTDMRAFFSFFGAFSEAPDPLVFLTDRGLAEDDIFHLLRLWQARMRSDPSVQRDALGMLARPTGEVPVVRVGPIQKAPLARPTPEKAPLASTALGFVVDRPALPFVPRVEGAPPPAFPPRSLRPAPRGLGETSLAFRVARPVLPFPKQASASATAEPRPSKAPALPSFGQTKPAFHLYKTALPFAAKALAQTAMTFQVNPRVLPFAKGAPPGGTPSPPARPLGETAPVFVSAKPVFPFPEAAQAPPSPPPIPRPAPAPSALAETSLALPIHLAVLPFARPNPSAPSTRLPIEAYATMCAEIWLDPPGALRIIARYGLSPETKRAEDAAWQARFAAAPAERAIWERLSIEAGARIRAGR